jgi:hypothetical protein
MKVAGSDCCVVCIAAVMAAASPDPDETDYTLNLPGPESGNGIVPEPLKKPPRSIA